MKKIAIAGICIASVLAVGAAGFGVFKVVKSGGDPVEVIPVSQFQGMGMMGDGSTLYANIVSDVSQEVHLASDQIVNEVYVKEGDKVKVGDKLLSYDTTLMELNLEMYELDGKTLDLKILGSKNDLEKLKKVTPLPNSTKNNNIPKQTPGNDLDDDDDDDGPGDEARAVLTDHFVTASMSQMQGSTNSTNSTDSTDSTGSTGDTNTPETQASESNDSTDAPETKPTDSPETPADTNQQTDAPSTEAPTELNSVIVNIGWDHGTNALAEYPSGVKVTLMNGDKQADVRTLTADNKWSTTFSNLDPSGTYTVKGEEVAEYTLITKEKPAGTFTLNYHYNEPADSPAATVKPYDILDYKSEPYKGEGTKKNPYVFFCKEGTIVKGSFINKMLGFDEKGEKSIRSGYHAKLEIREADSLTGGFIKSIGFDGTIKVTHGYAPGTSWIFTSDGIKKQETDINDPPKDDDKNGNWSDPGDVDWSDPGDFDDGYTEDELKQAIKEKEAEIRKLELDKRESDLKIEKSRREVNEATISSTINGVVKSVGDPSVGEIDGKAFVVITSDEGLYVKGAISELNLDTIKKGDVVQGMGNESGISFAATITEISPYPEDSNNYGFGEGNSNSSYYPFTAYIESADGLSNNESAQITISGGSGNADTIYLYKAYVRTENGQSYVYKVDENKRLKQQFVKTGKTLFSQYIEIKEGLTNEDKIAFPYGKNVKNGAKVKDADDTSEMMY